MAFKPNPMVITDFYKIGHPFQYNPNTTLVVSNETARKSRMDGVDHTIFFGLQYFIKKWLIDYFNEEFFNKPKEEVITSFKRRIKNALGVDIPTHHIEALHDLGYLPLKIKALPEGAKVPIKVPYFTIKNTQKKFFWLTNFIETIISCEGWQPITSATISFEYRKLFNEYAMKTVGNTGFVPWQGHDFSFRGMSSFESACLSGAGHLLNFTGTDTIPAIDWLEYYYKANSDLELIGGSVPATEHAVMCTNTGIYIQTKYGGDWERIGDCEFEVFKDLITKTYPTGIVSIVSDTWDLWKVIMEYLTKLKSEILARDGKVVIRPDSGDPVDILCGTLRWENKEEWENEHSICKANNQEKGVIELLWDIFGGTTTEKGYKLLDPHIGTIYGDSITVARAKEICQRLMDKGFASINWVAGIGSYTYQYNTRDTFGIAIKATYCEAEIDGKLYEVPIFKNPVTDSGFKKSAKGLLYVGIKDGDYYLEDNVSKEKEEDSTNCLEVVFEDGKLIKEYSLQEIRERVSKYY